MSKTQDLFDEGRAQGIQEGREMFSLSSYLVGMGVMFVTWIIGGLIADAFTSYNNTVDSVAEHGRRIEYLEDSITPSRPTSWTYYTVHEDGSVTAQKEKAH